MQRLAVAVALLFTVAKTAAATNDLNGVVVDELSKPLAGAHVYVYTAHPKVGVSAFCPSCYRDCGKHQEVSAKGAFRLQALDPTLSFDVLALADGYEPEFAHHVDPQSGPVTIKLNRRSTVDRDRLIVGTVVDPDGKAVVGAVVEPSGYRTGGTIGYGNIKGVDKLSITDARGAFSLRIPESDGRLDVRVIARALAPHIDRMLTPGEPRTIKLSEGATITGQVLQDGKPIAGVRVGFVQSNRASSGYLGLVEIATNDDGRFVMTNLGPSESYVVYTPTEGSPVSVVFEPKTVKVGGDKSDTDAGTFTVHPGRGRLGAR